MEEETVSAELPASDWHSVLSALKKTIEQKKENDADTEIITTLVLLYEEINQQLEDSDGAGHAHGLYSTTDNAEKQSGH